MGGSTELRILGIGLLTTLFIALPPLVAFAASNVGWKSALNAAAAAAAKGAEEASAPSGRWRRLGRFPVEELEDMYCSALVCHYNIEGMEIPESDALPDVEYTRVKMRLQRAGSKIVKLSRMEMLETIKLRAGEDT